MELTNNMTNCITYLESKEKLNQIAEEKKKQMLSSDKYILWLERFTIENGFCDNDWLYCPEEISVEDKINVDNFCLLFQIVELYAGKNYIPIKLNSSFYGGSYFIKYNNIGYEIGCISGQGILFYCERIPFEHIDSTFIDFKNIMCGKKQETTDLIEKKIKELADYLLSISKFVPIEVVKQTALQTIYEIESNNHLDNELSPQVLSKSKEKHQQY